MVDEAIIPLHFLPARSDGGVLFVFLHSSRVGILRREEIIKLNQKNIPRVISRSSEYSTVRSENRPDIVELCQRQTRQRERAISEIDQQQRNYIGLVLFKVGRIVSPHSPSSPLNHRKTD